MSAVVPVNCFHCGEPVERPGLWRVRIAGSEREMCCAGCRAVAEAIDRAGLGDYYRTRTRPAQTAMPSRPDAAPQAWDDDAILARFTRATDTPLREATLLIDGLRCGACVWLLEETLRRQPGVTQASVQLAGERAHVLWDAQRTPLSALLAATARVGYTARPFDAREREQQTRRTSKALFQRLFIAALAMMQVMMFAFPSYIAAPGEIEPGHASLLRWASLLLTIPVVFYSASPFLAGAWRDLRARSPGMDVPVSIGIVAAFSASVHATIAGRGEVWFDSVTMFVCLLLGARYLEWRARHRAGQAIDAITASAPDTVERIDPVTGSSERIPVTQLAPGDRFRVSTGERVGVDARIIEGDTAIDRSLLTGESRALPHGPGDEVPGGAINAGNPFTALALRNSKDSAISTIERLVLRAAASRPRLAGLSERVARIFVSALLLLAALVWLIWLQIDPARALPIAIAVLVVSCPCALSMAVPTALAAATGTAIRQGMLIARADALERIATCTDVVFDKTGTLTAGRPQLATLEPMRAGDDRQRLLALCAALESGQTHPLADAIRRAATESGQDDGVGKNRFAASDVQTHPGLGLEARIGERRYRLGSLRWVGEWHPLTAAGDAAASRAILHPPVSDALSSVWLVDDLRPLARLDLHDRLRDEAADTVSLLAERGLRVHLLSGDRSGAVLPVARELGIAAATGDASPADKLAHLRALQAGGRRVLMVGDGINDAPVLAAADVSVAVSNATSLARTAAGVVLLDESLRGLIALHALAVRTRSIVRQNLAWALVYNAIAIPAAALGWVPPWLAALGMTGSSVAVVLNAARLSHVPKRPRRQALTTAEAPSWKRSTC